MPQTDCGQGNLRLVWLSAQSLRVPSTVAACALTMALRSDLTISSSSCLIWAWCCDSKPAPCLVACNSSVTASSAAMRT